MAKKVVTISPYYYVYEISVFIGCLLEIMYHKYNQR